VGRACRGPSPGERSRSELAHQATSDGLTGLLNRSAFHTQLHSEVAQALASGRPLSLALLDLDHFKAIHDTHGHRIGDQVLTETARRLHAAGRAGDHLARIGREEFAWILPNTDGLGALTAAERARRSVEQTGVGEVGCVTLSVGICELRDAGDVEELYRLADVALYSAKQGRRNRCVRYAPARPQAR
jgi:diguanylate cyclase (GGDEF)-like protein